MVSAALYDDQVRLVPRSVCGLVKLSSSTSSSSSTGYLGFCVLSRFHQFLWVSVALLDGQVLPVPQLLLVTFLPLTLCDEQLPPVPVSVWGPV